MKTKTTHLFSFGITVALLFTLSCTNNSSEEPTTNNPSTVINFGLEVPKDTVNVTMTSDSEINWNDARIDSLVLADSLKALISRSIESGKRKKEYNGIGTHNRANYVVSLNCYPQSSYGLYTFFMDELATVIDTLRNEYAKDIYNIPFEELTDDQSIIMRSIVNYTVLENPIKL